MNQQFLNNCCCSFSKEIRGSFVLLSETSFFRHRQLVIVLPKTTTNKTYACDAQPLPITSNLGRGSVSLFHCSKQSTTVELVSIYDSSACNLRRCVYASSIVSRTFKDRNDAVSRKSAIFTSCGRFFISHDDDDDLLLLLLLLSTSLSFLSLIAFLIIDEEACFVVNVSAGETIPFVMLFLLLRRKEEEGVNINALPLLYQQNLLLKI